MDQLFDVMTIVGVVGGVIISIYVIRKHQMEEWPHDANKNRVYYRERLYRTMRDLIVGEWRYTVVSDSNINTWPQSDLPSGKLVKVVHDTNKERAVRRINAYCDKKEIWAVSAWDCRGMI